MGSAARSCEAEREAAEAAEAAEADAKEDAEEDAEEEEAMAWRRVAAARTEEMPVQSERPESSSTARAVRSPSVRLAAKKRAGMRRRPACGVVARLFMFVQAAPSNAKCIKM